MSYEIEREELDKIGDAMREAYNRGELDVAGVLAERLGERRLVMNAMVELEGNYWRNDSYLNDAGRAYEIALEYFTELGLREGAERVRKRLSSIEKKLKGNK